MRADDLYRQLVVTLAHAGIAVPYITEISDPREYSEKKAEQITNEADDYIEAAIRLGRKDRPA